MFAVVRDEGMISTNLHQYPKIDAMLWIPPLMLSCLGILMVTSTTSPMSFEISGTPFTMGIRQFQWLIMALMAMVLSYAVPSGRWRYFSGALWGCALLLVILTLIPGVGTSVGGAKRWLRFAGISIQPAEILCFALVPQVARIMDKYELDPLKCFSKILLLNVISIIPLLAQPDLGSTLLVLFISMGMFVERFGWKLPLGLASICIFIMPLLIMMEPYRMRRVTAFINPWQDPLDTGFQVIQGLIAFANGGAWGSGLGHGLQKLQYLPAAYTDFIYAALGEELGLLGTLGALTLCFVWMLRCRRLYRMVPIGYNASMVWGVTLTIVVPLFINIGGVTRLMPLTGMPLPFLSYGGSSLIMMWIRVGVLMRLHRDAVMEAMEP